MLATRLPKRELLALTPEEVNYLIDHLRGDKPQAQQAVNADDDAEAFIAHFRQLGKR